MRLFDLVPRRPRRSPDAAVDEATPAPADFGGPFGYGHPAHRPDPEARYDFQRDQERLLPVLRKLRWR